MCFDNLTEYSSYCIHKLCYGNYFYKSLAVKTKETQTKSIFLTTCPSVAGYPTVQLMPRMTMCPSVAGYPTVQLMPRMTSVPLLQDILLFS